MIGCASWCGLSVTGGGWAVRRIVSAGPSAAVRGHGCETSQIRPYGQFFFSIVRCSLPDPALQNYSLSLHTQISIMLVAGRDEHRHCNTYIGLSS